MLTCGKKTSVFFIFFPAGARGQKSGAVLVGNHDGVVKYGELFF